MRQLNDEEVRRRLFQVTRGHGAIKEQCQKAGVSPTLMSMARSGSRQVPRVIAEQCLNLWTRQTKPLGQRWNPIEYYEE